jgi:NDP-hexose-3-ketoreductase
MSRAGSPVRIGVLGCADIARRRILPAIAELPEFELAAVASRDADRAAKVAADHGCAAVTGYQRLLDEQDGVDAVYVPLPTALHAQWAERALRAGKHVLVEKPLAIEPARAQAVVALARARGLALMENFMFLHHRQQAEVRRLLDDGAIGELRSMSAVFGIPPRPADDIRYVAGLGGGAALDQGVYPLRLAQFFLGPDLAVVGACLREDPARGVDVAGAALLVSPGGVTAQLTFGMDHGYRSAYRLWGSTGQLVVERAFTPPPSHRASVLVATRAGRREVSLEPDDQASNTLRAFARAVGAADAAGSGRAQPETAPSGTPIPGPNCDDPAIALARLIAAVRDQAITQT